MQLIRAKLYPPRLSPDLVSRPRLVQQLNKGLARKLSLVSAPTGFGKTTLLSEWAQQASCPVAWVTFDADDNDLHSFLTYFVAAVESVYPHSCDETQSLVNVPTLPPANVLAALLANELSLLAGELILILDDYHTLQEMAIHNLMERLIAYLPPTFHLVLGTRNSPPLPLVTLRAQGQLCELRQPNLRFTVQETRTFFDQAGQVTLDDEVLEELDQRTEGWATGLRLLLLSMAGYDDLRTFASRFSLGDTDIMSFLTDQVLAKLSPAVLHFLLCTAIVERFCLPLYRVLAPESRAEDEDDSLLAHVLRDNLFVVALGEGWYRYHALFRELLLQHHERQIGRHGLAELHRHASGWFEQNGMIGDAIRHGVKAGDEALAISVLVRHRIEAMNQEQWPLLEHWLALFPPSLIEGHPILGMTQAWIFDAREMDAAQIAAIKRLEIQLLKEESSLCPEIHKMLLGELNAHLSDISFFRGDFQTSITQGQLGLELLPLHLSHARAIIYIFLSGSYRYTGNLALSEETMQVATREEPVHNDSFAGRITIPSFVFAFIDLKLKAAERTALQLKARAQQGGLLDSLCWANYYLGRVAYVENRLDDARGYFEEVMTHRHAARFTPAVDTFLCLALINQAQALPEAALELAAQLVEALRTPGAQVPLPVVEALHAHLALLQGRLDQAVAWMERVSRHPAYVPTAWSQIIPFTIIRVLLAEGSAESLNKSALMLSEMQQIARTTGSLMHLTQLLVFEAVLQEQLGEHSAALATLNQALTLAQPSRAIRLFADLGIDSSSRLSSLLHEVDGNSATHGFARLVLAALPAGPLPRSVAGIQSAKPTLPVPGMVEQLSQREIEILRLMEEGMSNKQIGQQLFISAKTVENHTTNIFQKLGVRNRMQAARRANELRLLSPH